MVNIITHIKNRALSHVVRYSARPQHFQESVAEHSFYTAYITNLLCDLLSRAGEEVNKEKAVTMALIHDMEEMYSGDILGPFKHYSKEVSSAIRTVNEELIKETFSDLPDDLAKEYENLWVEEGKQVSIEAQLVKKADQLSLIAKCAEEVKAGNGYFEKIYKKHLEKLQEDNTPWWTKIKREVLGH
jgi:5'-deoxynucleotidase